MGENKSDGLTLKAYLQPQGRNYRVASIKHLLTNCTVNAEKYSDRSSDIWTERSELIPRAKVQTFSALTKQLVNKSFIL